MSGPELTPGPGREDAHAQSVVAFLDFEASGLGAQSWPIEVGWAIAAAPKAYDDSSAWRGAPDDALEAVAAPPAEAALIAPDARWSMDAWDPTAERLHGLSIDCLRKDGAPAVQVCARLNAALAGVRVYSDATNWDGFWLMRLYEVGGLRPSFELLDFAGLIRPLIGPHEAAFFEAAKAAPPRRHRAAPDAVHLRALFEIACAI